MVSFFGSELQRWIVAEPNCSASWRTNRLLIAGLTCWCGAIAMFFLSLGLWPVLPFLGLEVLAVAAGLYYVCWKVRQRHVLRLEVDAVVVEKGDFYPRMCWRLPRATTSLSVLVPDHPWDPLAIFICCQGEQIPLGDFLNKDDCIELLRLLREVGLPVRNYSALAHIEL